MLSAVAFAARQVNAQLLELSVQVCSLEACFFGHTGHGAALVRQMEFKVGFFEGVTRLAQGAVEFKALLVVWGRCRQAGH